LPPTPCFYILSRGRFGTLTLGASGDIAAELRQERLARGGDSHLVAQRLVHLELYDETRKAEERWHQVRRWGVGSRLRLIRSSNPGWIDYAQDWQL
ncbi:MAG TPA: hypothetical protein VGE22_10480, partial [Solimonas sp.]